ncbi:hypothetical protein QP157_20300 [Sphingomonas sp. LR61]|uniref:hypothetical protein n=1 Tax=Sphingomonas sp. LR61 TaxID=3050234 RepID=UPI002FDF81C3
MPGDRASASTVNRSACPGFVSSEVKPAAANGAVTFCSTSNPDVPTPGPPEPLPPNTHSVSVHDASV